MWNSPTLIRLMGPTSADPEQLIVPLGLNGL